MDLHKAIKGMLDAENNLRTPQGVSNPSVMSENMMRLSQYLGAVEEHLAQYEKDYEITLAQKLHNFMVTQGIKPTPAEARAKMELGEIKGQVVYLSRLVSSGWRQVGVIQSRINHLTREAQTQL